MITPLGLYRYNRPKCRRELLGVADAAIEFHFTPGYGACSAAVDGTIVPPLSR